MSRYQRGRLAAVTVCLCAASGAVPAFGQQPAPAGGSFPRADIVISPTRVPTAISRVGSAISVITREEIEKASAKDVSDLLRRVPGLTLTQNGGPGATQTVRLRGMDARHTLVLVDGVRVNDPTSTGGEFDFAALVPTDIERIEVLRGPQTALYGSDALGGVIAITTRRGRGAPRVSLQAEGGSYGTRSVRGSVSGSLDRISYAFSATDYQTAGFSRYGYRIGRIERNFPWGLEPDAARRSAVTGRIGVDLAETLKLEIGGSAALNRSQFDGGFGAFPDTPSNADTRLYNGYARLSGTMFDIWRHSVTAFATITDRDSRGVSFGGVPVRPSRTDFFYNGHRNGVEYQGDVNFGALGTFVYGAKVERENYLGTSRSIFPVSGLTRLDDSASQVTDSIYAMHQISLFQRLHLSLGVRSDNVEAVKTFNTGRFTAAYEIPETGTKLRASLGTGGKAPSLYQRFSTLYGTRGLVPEESVGVDAGIDQVFLDGRATLSATIFRNRYKNFIDFATSPTCQPFQAFGCYINIGRAATRGVEVEGKAILIDGLLEARLAYTYLRAEDLSNRRELARRPRNEARIAFTITPWRDLTIEPAIVVVDRRYSGTNQTQKLKAYARLDVLADYRINETFTAFVRAENLTDSRYQEVRDYGTAGRSFYGGVRATW